jgi:hypothetical protein
MAGSSKTIQDWYANRLREYHAAVYRVYQGGAVRRRHIPRAPNSAPRQLVPIALSSPKPCAKPTSFTRSTSRMRISARRGTTSSRSPARRRTRSVKSIEEAKAYLDHPVLGPRLRECADAVVHVEGRSATEIFGSPDDLKLRRTSTILSLRLSGEHLEVRVLKRGQHAADAPRAKWPLFKLGRDN